MKIERYGNVVIVINPIAKTWGKESQERVEKLLGVVIYRRYRKISKEIKPVKVKRFTNIKERRKRRILANGGFHTEEEWKSLVNREPYCHGCGRTDVKLQKDHIKPIYRGGSDSIDNLQPLCWPCNSKKNSQYPYKFEFSKT